MTKDIRLIQSIERAMNILKCFEKSEELGVTEISHLTKLHKSTAFNIIQTLEHLGALEQNIMSGKYKLGLELFRLGTLVNSNVRNITRPYLEKLLDMYSETVNLVVRTDISVLFIETIESPHAAKVSTREGKKLPIYCTAVGKAILSTLNEAELNDLLGKINFFKRTKNTISNKEILLKELDAVRTAGFAIDLEEFENGSIGVAAPIINHFGKAEYAISIACPAHRMNKEALENIGQTLVGITKEISKKIGY